MTNKLILLGILLLLVSIVACKRDKLKSPIPDSLSDLEEVANPAYRVNVDSVYQLIHSHLLSTAQTNSWDSALVAHYGEKGNFLWLEDLSGKAADSLLFWLENIPQHGINPEIYPTTSLREKLTRMRTFSLQDGETMNRLLADVEYQLTASYLSYVCRLKYGFLPPKHRGNDTVEWVPLKRCDMKFALSALDSLKANPIAAFRWAQPSSRLYLGMQRELERVNSWGETDTTDYYRNRLLVNMERERWQYAQDKGRKYVVANVAASMLQAVNEKTDSILEMRICNGSVRNKTPLLSSKIYYMELNPYWNVPQSIIRKEIIPIYRRDTTYFTRHRMKVYTMDGAQVDPHSIKWSKYADKGVPYKVKQDNKAGNSLGRIIFRFPNRHDVYLHDTPVKWAFGNKRRAISHGCVRLEKALDFAFFLLKERDKLLEDQIRIAMDIKPISEEGKKLSRSSAYQELQHYSLKEYIPLYIDYRTVFLSVANKFSYCEDIYGYDTSLLKEMNNLKLKP